MQTLTDSSFWQITSADIIQQEQGSDLIIIKAWEHAFFNKEHLYVTLKFAE